MKLEPPRLDSLCTFLPTLRTLGTDPYTTGILHVNSWRILNRLKTTIKP